MQIWILLTELVLSEEICVLHLFTNVQARKQPKGYYFYQAHLLFWCPHVLKFQYTILYYESPLLYKTYYTSSNRFNFKRFKWNSVTSSLCRKEKKIFQTVTWCTAYFYQIIYKTGYSAQMYIQIATAPQYMVSILPSFPSIPRKPRANGHPCP